MNAPYTGGSSPSGQLFMVDGDFTSCDPCGLPVISYPLKGDSIFSNRDILYFNKAEQAFFLAALGEFPNIQPWSPNQTAVVLEQEFMVAQSSYFPMRLNTRYYPGWAIGWEGQFPDGSNTVNLNELFLVTEGELVDMGGGISKLKRTWASIPQTRNEVEQFTYTFIGYADEVSGTTRSRPTFVVQSRVQYDYFIFDDLDITGLTTFPNGPALNAETGIYPQSLILPEQYYFANQDGIAQNIFVDSLDDGDEGSDIDTITVPTFTGYTALISGASTSNGLAAEIIAEGSTMTRFMGNIWERRTRFVIAQ
jgi:hypothetical protein